MDDVTNNFEIIEDSEEAKDNFGLNYGSETKYISLDDIEALKEGKLLATDINSGEYSLFLKLDRRDDD